MFAVNCPYCRHANKRGARYCADCGAALHLKPCPKCGKVDEVTATKCVNCGTGFPAIELADYLPDQETEQASGSPGATAKAAHPPTLRAGPLIVIALVAGGLPFLWMNRDRLPQPGDLQATPPGRLAVPAPLPAVAPAQVAPLTPAVSAPVVETPPATPAEAPAAVPAAAPPAPAAAAPKPPPIEVPKPRQKEPAPERRPAVSPPAEPKKPAAQAVEDRSSRQRPTTEQTAPARECTESLAALGLCEPRR